MTEADRPGLESIFMISRQKINSLFSFSSFFSHDQLEHIVDRVVAEADTNEDGFISFEEFQEAISKLDVEQKMAFIGFK